MHNHVFHIYKNQNCQKFCIRINFLVFEMVLNSKMNAWDNRCTSE
jgi:hypothetical protein